MIPSMITRTVLDRLRTWLGHDYPAAVEVVDRALTAFILTLAGGAVLTVGLWKAAALAGVVAGLSAIKSVLLTALTGTPALLGLVSPNLRFRRDLPRAFHKIPVRTPR